MTHSTAEHTTFFVFKQRLSSLRNQSPVSLKEKKRKTHSVCSKDLAPDKQNNIQNASIQGHIINLLQRIHVSWFKKKNLSVSESVHSRQEEEVCRDSVSGERVLAYLCTVHFYWTECSSLPAYGRLRTVYLVLIYWTHKLQAHAVLRYPALWISV